MSDSTRQKICFVSAVEMADRLDVRAETVRRWAHMRVLSDRAMSARADGYA